MKKPKKIEVWWEDHHERDGQGAPLTKDELKPLVWVSLGYLVSENDSMIELARDWSSDEGVIGVGASLRIMKKGILKRSDRRGDNAKTTRQD